MEQSIQMDAFGTSLHFSNTPLLQYHSSLITIHILISWGGKIAPRGQKLQIPTSKPQRNIKQQIPKVLSRDDRFWGLKLGASLDVGAWNLELPRLWSDGAGE